MKKIPVRLLKFLNVVCMLFPFGYVWFAYYEPLTMTVASKQVSVLVMMSYIFIFFSLTENLDGFRWDTRSIVDLIFSQIISVGATDVAALILIWMLSIHFPHILPGMMCFGVQCIVVVICCGVGHTLFFATHPPRETVIVYDVLQGMEELISGSGLNIRYNILASYAIEELIKPDASEEETERIIAEKLSEAEDVFMCGIHTHNRNIILKYCVYNNKRVFIIPRIGDMLMSSATRMHMFYLPFLRVKRYDPPATFLVVKRGFDILASGLAMILTSPIMLVVALLVRSDGGPVFYKQVRLTKDGKRFRLIKFRSMCVDAEKHTGAVRSAGKNDPRITKVGKFIRACRLDELPQLWNVFAGDMSIVGPRPERPELAAEFEKEMPEFALRLQCKAGLTGYAQVYGRYNTTPYDKTLMDLMYIAHPSILEDLVIMLATVRVLFSRESTAGIGEAETELRYEERNV